MNIKIDLTVVHKTYGTFCIYEQVTSKSLVFKVAILFLFCSRRWQSVVFDVLLFSVS